MPRSAVRRHLSPVPVPGGAPESTPAERIAGSVAALAAALELPEVAFRAGQAGVLVRIDCTDRAVQPIFLALDTEPVHVTLEPPARRPGVVLTMRTEDLEAGLRQGVELPLRILSGEVAFEGPVRKFLRVLPVLRAAITDAAG